MSRYRLHYFPESGNSYKLALMLALCGQPFEPVWTDFGAGVTRTPEWRAAVNPMGEIPVLEDHGVARAQTAPILVSLAAEYGRFGADTPAGDADILRWLFWDNHKLSGTLAPHRYLRTFTPDPVPEVITYLRSRADAALAILDAELTRRPFITGDRPTIADLSMTGYLVWPGTETGYDLPASHPAVQAWLDRIAALPGWRPPADLLPGRRLTRYR